MQCQEMGKVRIFSPYGGGEAISGDQFICIANQRKWVGLSKIKIRVQERSFGIAVFNIHCSGTGERQIMENK